MKLRLAETADAPQLEEMARAFLAEEGVALSAAEIKRNLAGMMAHPAAVIWVAEAEDGDCMGFMTATSTAGLEFGRSAELEDLYLLPAYRGRGHSRQLMEAAVDWGRREGVRKMILVVTPEGRDQGLPEFYRKMGYQELDRSTFIRDLD